MTAGVLIFAYNNEHIDYVAMAAWSAKNIRRHLNLPVAVVTNTAPPLNYKFEQIIIADSDGKSKRNFADIAENVTWYNGNRIDAYTLSPWSQTLVLDADYVVASNQLQTLLEVEQDFLAPRQAYDITGLQTFEDLNVYGRYKMPMSWATVMMFRRSKTAELIFECMSMIKNNWQHYCNLYGINRSTYRNDFALSIAMNIVDGHTLSTPNIPWQLASVTPEHALTQVDADTYRVEYVTPNKKPRYITINHDFHAMGKGHLGAIVANNS
jgi:hypothetical protein